MHPTDGRHMTLVEKGAEISVTFQTLGEQETQAEQHSPGIRICLQSLHKALHTNTTALRK